MQFSSTGTGTSTDPSPISTFLTQFANALQQYAAAQGASGAAGTTASTSTTQPTTNVTA